MSIESRIRTVIVDDEPLARDKIREFLRSERDFEVVGEFANGREAVRRVSRLAPDLIFLDIQMPGLSGFDVLAELPADHRPSVVFVTAYDSFALRAFEVNALDYLLKPFDRDRFDRTLARVRAERAQPDLTHVTAQLDALLEHVVTKENYLQRVSVRSAGRILFLHMSEVDWIEAEENYVRLYIGHISHLLRHTISGLEAKLDPRQFVRIHRSAIVNVDRISRLDSTLRGEYALELRDGTRLVLAPKQRQRVLDLMQA